MAKKVRFDVVPAWSRDGSPTAIADTHLNYFTCTLGEAARWNAEQPHPFLTVNDLIDEQARELRQRPALNIAGDCHAEDGRELKSDYTYRELRTFSLAVAVRLRRRLQVASRVGSGTAGLLCSSSPEFILTWLGLMRLGVSVMLLAPELGRTAIKHLCSECKVTTIFTDGRNYQKVKNIQDGILAINISHILYGLRSDPINVNLPFNPRVEDIAYLFSTSGTSTTSGAASDLPEPIPQSHHSAASVLPNLPGGENHAIFSAIPLHHHGIADCLRAWTSGAMIHLFSGTEPLTASNIHRAVDQADAYLDGACLVKYFTCEPQTLKILAQETSKDQGKRGLRLLQRMDLVGVGADLSPSVGNYLVANDVNLVVRFRRAECGLLLSSHRDYDTDRDWSYLRADPTLQPDYYDFEPHTQIANKDSPPLFELVVRPEWPHRDKTNRPDGSFATGDLFQGHPSIPNAWRYHSRAEEHVALSTGGKFDPTPVEGVLLASEGGRRVLDDVMVFGTGREVPGVLLLSMWNEAFVSDEEVVQEVWPAIEKLNKDSHDHAKIGKDVLVVARSQTPTGETSRLPKSDKGTILREQAEKMFAEKIQTVYKEASQDNGKMEVIPDDKVMDELASLFDETMGRHIDVKRNLSAQGLDSTAYSQIRDTISKKFFSETDTTLPLNIVRNQGCIEQLSEYILRRRGSRSASPVGATQQIQQ